jgi:hypothetical protein
LRNVYAWVTQMEDGQWSFVGILTPDGHIPAVSHNRGAIERCRHFAVAHGKALNQPVEFVMWRAMETLERIEPTV